MSAIAISYLYLQAGFQLAASIDRSFCLVCVPFQEPCVSRLGFKNLQWLA
jgi:hypothetical protein